MKLQRKEGINVKNNKLQIDINDFVEERLSESLENISNNNEYKKVKENYYTFFNNIKEIIPNIKLLNHYKEAEHDMYTIQLKQAYKTGFQDGIKIIIDKKDNV